MRTTTRSARFPFLTLPIIGLLLVAAGPLFSGCNEETHDTPNVSVDTTIAQTDATEPESPATPSQPSDTSDDARPGQGATGTLYLHRAKETVGRSIPEVLIRKVEVDGPTMIVQLRENDEIPVYEDYYEIADQRNRIIAIETVRWFRDLPALGRIALEIPSPQGLVRLNLDRNEVADYYGISFDNLRENVDSNEWRENFLVRWDNAEARQAFVEKHR